MTEDLVLPWHEVQAGRSVWSVAFYPKIIYQGEHVHGLTWFRKRLVMLDATMPMRRIRPVRRHELFHVLCFEGRGRKRAGEAERHAEEDFANLFGRAGHLVGVPDFPLPEGFRSFRRRCRGVEKVVL